MRAHRWVVTACVCLAVLAGCVETTTTRTYSPYVPPSMSSSTKLPPQAPPRPGAEEGIVVDLRLAKKEALRAPRPSRGVPGPAYTQAYKNTRLKRTAIRAATHPVTELLQILLATKENVWHTVVEIFHYCGRYPPCPSSKVLKTVASRSCSCLPRRALCPWLISLVSLMFPTAPCGGIWRFWTSRAPEAHPRRGSVREGHVSAAAGFFRPPIHRGGREGQDRPGRGRTDRPGADADPQRRHDLLPGRPLPGRPAA